MIKINKRQARKEFTSGKTIRVVPCKLAPDNIWGCYYNLRALDEECRVAVDGCYKRLDRGWLFDNWITRWYYTNPGYEQGYYPAFYLVD